MYSFPMYTYVCPHTWTSIKYPYSLFLSLFCGIQGWFTSAAIWATLLNIRRYCRFIYVNFIFFFYISYTQKPNFICYPSGLRGVYDMMHALFKFNQNILFFFQSTYHQNLCEFIYLIALVSNAATL